FNTPSFVDVTRGGPSRGVWDPPRVPSIYAHGGTAEDAVADESNPTVPEKPPAPAEKRLADLLAEAFRLYRGHARPMLLICALLFVRMSLAKSCAVSALLGPKVAAASAAEVVDLARAVEASRQALSDAYAHEADAATITRLQLEYKKRLEDLS